MKVFISWSGELSHKVAEALHLWLPTMIQSIDPFLSSEDTYKGQRWGEVVATELENTNYGILCITRDNVDRPWLNFEAGALSKSIEKGRVSPFLINLKPAEITGPLLQFQATSYSHGEVLKLVKSMNSVLKSPLEDARIERGFRALWPQLQQPIDYALKGTAAADSSKSAKPIRTTEAMVSEVLDLVRIQQKTLADIAALPGTSGSAANKIAVLKEVDLTEVGYLLKRLRGVLDTASIPGKSETSAMVQARAIVDLIMKCLAPALPSSS